MKKADEQKGWVRKGTGPWHRWTGYAEHQFIRPFCGALLVRRDAEIRHDDILLGYSKFCKTCNEVAAK